MYDLVIEGRIIQDNMPVEAYVCLKGSRISAIKRSIPGHIGYSDFLKVGNALVLPGAIDTHVHLRDPGYTYKEDFSTGTISAAFGGVTSLVDMPNTNPPVITKKELREKNEIALKKSYIDFGLNFCILADSNLAEVRSLFQKDSSGPAPFAMKVFLGETTGSLVFKPIKKMIQLTDILIDTGSVLCLHAEDGSKFSENLSPDENSNKESIIEAHDSYRPVDAEVSAIKKSIQIMGDACPSLHFLHVSSERGINATIGSGCSVEVTPHHLLLDIKCVEKNIQNQALCKVNPPIRNTTERAALWKRVLDGTVTNLGSDHAPHTLSEKESVSGSPSGIPGTETMIPLMLGQVKKGRLSIARLMELMASNPARRFGLHQKGKIDIGYLADLMIVDMNDICQIRPESLHSKAGWTPYEKMEAIFPKKVFSRGDLIVDEGILTNSIGRGKNLRSR